MNLPKIVVHTDVLAEHLVHTGKGRSVLRWAMQKFFCYATVFSAIELFAIARSERERQLIAHTFSAVKILGLNSRSATKIGAWISKQPTLPRLNILIGGVCLESRLPLLVMQPDEFRGVKGLRIIPASRIEANVDGDEILKAMR